MPSFTPLAALILLVARVGPAEPLRCSLFYSVLGRSDVWFMGTALPDTLAAGPGSVRFESDAPGHAGPGGAGSFRGQLIRVDRLPEGADTGLAAAVRDAGGRVLLVPWDYAADCRTVPRTARTDWVAANTSGLFSGHLRRREEWAGVIPTLDVHAPEFVPYPSAPGLERGQRYARERPWATADELFEAVASMPRSLPGDSTGDEFARSADRWAASHPALALLEPIAGDLGRIRGGYLRRHASFHRIRSPLAGTWRVTVALASGDTLPLYVRSAESPISAQYDTTRLVAPLTADSEQRPPLAYQLYSRFSVDSGALTGERTDPTRTTEGYLEVVTEPVHQSGDSTVWLGALSVLSEIRRLYTRWVPAGILRALWEAERQGDSAMARVLDASALDAISRQLMLADHSSMRQRFRGSGPRYPARFVMRGGRMTGVETLVVNGRLLLTISAVRVDTMSYRGNRPPRGSFR